MTTIETVLFTQEDIDMIKEALNLYLEKKIEEKDYDKSNKASALRYRMVGVKSIEDLKKWEKI